MTWPRLAVVAVAVVIVGVSVGLLAAELYLKATGR